MAGRDAQAGPSGGTGFLFGNIDKQGRLDEEYLSDDAKDTIDNVGAKVVNENDRQLREIEALPLKSTAPPDHHFEASDGVDYYDEDDDMDQATRSHMAAVALRHAAAAPNDDDDDYDELDDPTPSTQQPPTLPRKPAAAPPHNPALAEQLRLMAEARSAQPTVQPPPLSTDPDTYVEEHPVPFSRFFIQPPPALRFIPRLKTYGFKPPLQPVHHIHDDDAELLERRPAIPAVDPAQVVVALDRNNAHMRRPPQRNHRQTPRVHNPDEYLQAARPLDDSIHVHHTDERHHALVQQAPWEDDILWQHADDDDDDEPWCTPDSHQPPDTENTAAGNSHLGFTDAASKAVGSDDDDDDDDDEFEDAVVMNIDQPEENGTLDLSQNDPDSARNGGGQDEHDEDDDDMEWEDGAATTKTPTATATPLDQQQTPHGATSQDKVKGATVVQPSANAAKEHERASQKSHKEETANGEKQLVESSSKSTSGSDVIQNLLTPNRDIAEGTWVHAIEWDSHSESESEVKQHQVDVSLARALREKFSRLILDMNDSNMVLENLSDDSKDNGVDMRVNQAEDFHMSKTRMRDLIYSSRTQVSQLLEADRFNISNDLYYARGTSNHLKVDRKYVLRGLENAPPALKCQTTKTCIPEEELLSFRRPKLSMKSLPKSMVIQPLRRKRPKGGNAQIAGQIPKRKTELQCSEKDAYRVSLYEYPLERQPPIMLVPGMASRIITYQRKRSAAEAQKASKEAAGTADADTVFMSPDEIPPVAAGDIQSDEKPLSVMESHVLAAPCVKTTAQTTDFLLVHKGSDMYVREIDSLIGLGVTEPKVEVMAPNTEKYKRYAKDRAYLWIQREFSRQHRDLVKAQKKKRDIDGALRVPPFITKEEIWREFFRRRTYPQGSLSKLLKDLALYQNGRYTRPEEPKPGTPRESDLLRTLNPTKAAAFEAMEAGWEQLLDRGIRIYTHPSSQGNLLAAADPAKSGLEFGTAVGTYFKCHLLKTPWYVSANKVAVHRAQREELLQVLSLARIVNDLREGGNVMETRLMSLSHVEMNNVLSNHYKLNAKKIPLNVDERRDLVREMSQRKTKSNSFDVSNYSQVIANVLKKHRDAGLGKGAAIAAQGTAMLSGTFIGLPLGVQRRALEYGDVEDLPIEEEDYYPEKNGEAVYAAAKTVLSKRKENRMEKDRLASKTDGMAKKKHFTSVPPSGISAAKPPLPQSSSSPKKAGTSVAKGNTADEAKPKKKRTRLKVTTKVYDADGKPQSVVTYVTDPDEVSRILESRRRKMEKKETGSKSQSASSTGGLKIAIDLKRLSQGSKAATVGKGGFPEKKKPTKKSGKKSEASPTPSVRKIAGEKGQIGKIKISTKKLHSNKEQAALKRKRSQYGEDIDYRAKKTAKTSRRKRNGKVQLNGIFERIEKAVRETEGYIVPSSNPIRIARLKNGESPPPNIVPSNLAIPKGTGLDFTAPVDTKTVPTYLQIVKKPVYLNLVRQKCRKQEYMKGSEFLADMELMASNARLFNSSSDVQWVVQHAELLLEVAVEQVSRKADEIQAAEEMVRLEKEEAAKAGHVGPKSKKSKGKNSKSKKNSSRKANAKEVVVIPDSSGPESQAGPRGSPEIVDLSGDAPTADQPRYSGSSPAASPDVGVSMLDAGITADDIYAIDRPETPADGLQESADHLVLDLGDVGGNDVL